MALQATAIYAGILGLISIVLAAFVGRARAAAKIPLGEGGDRGIVEANRRHMNFVENVPLALLLLAAVELNGSPKSWVHVLGLALLAGRIIHPFGIDADKMNTWQRGAGAGLTFLMMLACCLTLLKQGLLG
jgi:uncharacterized membrane protein YecN with MAPEG domain